MAHACSLASHIHSEMGLKKDRCIACVESVAERDKLRRQQVLRGERASVSLDLQDPNAEALSSQVFLRPLDQVH